MSVGLPSDEVAEDYKNSLEDLTMNSRYEISNLTVIAKENTVHAETISRVLENHIRNVSASTSGTIVKMTAATLNSVDCYMEHLLLIHITRLSPIANSQLCMSLIPS